MIIFTLNKMIKNKYVNNNPNYLGYFKNKGFFKRYNQEGHSWGNIPTIKIFSIEPLKSETQRP